MASPEEKPPTVAELEKIGLRRVLNTDNISIKPEHGTSRAYTLDRLLREDVLVGQIFRVNTNFLVNPKDVRPMSGEQLVPKPRRQTSRKGRPDVVCAVRRTGFRRYWRWKSRPPGGRPQN